MLEAQGSKTLQPAQTETMLAIAQLIDLSNEYFPRVAFEMKRPTMPPVQQATYRWVRCKGSDAKDYRYDLKEIICKGSLGRFKRLKIGTTCVLTAALAKASPSPALVIDPWEPALKARKPKSRIRNPRQQKGIEWPEMPPALVHRSVLVRGWCTSCYETCRDSGCRGCRWGCVCVRVRGFWMSGRGGVGGGGLENKYFRSFASERGGDVRGFYCSAWNYFTLCPGAIE